MSDYPIIFSGPMVRALLDGRKTQTRRLAYRDTTTNRAGETYGLNASRWKRVQPGDRLWVREAWGRTTNVNDQPSWPGRAHIALDPGEVIIFAADGHWQWCGGDGFALERSMWRPPIHMSRWASRITLHVEAVRVERLQDITEEDACEEGAPHLADSGATPWTDGFAYLWNKLHGPGAWEANPEVAALTFRVERRNIDA